jgi:hypothetical protein
MKDDGDFTISYDLFSFWHTDYVRREISVVHIDGTVHTEPMESAPAPGLASSTFDWEKWWLITRTLRNDVVIFLGFNPETGNPVPEVPTVYLDQNKWSQLAMAAVDPSRIANADERKAALRLLELAGDDGVILPLSSAHLVETSRLHTEKRYEVGVAMASLSNGWLMRHPLDIVEDEAGKALIHHVEKEPLVPLSSRAVITTEPNAWRRKEEEFGLGNPLLPDTETFLEMISAAASVVTLLIDPQKLSRSEDQRWVHHHQRVSDQIGNLGGGKEQRRITARRRFWNDNLRWYSDATHRLYGRRDLPMFSNEALESFLLQTPALSLLSELFTRRFMDSQTKWRRNDLIDMHYLSCGAAYCDFVVGERHTGSQLRQIQRSQGKRESVYTSLTDLVAALESVGVQTATERASDAG